MRIVSWYFAENGGRHVRQVLVRLPGENPVPPVIDNLIADPAFMTPNWAATVLSPVGSSPVVFAKANGAIEMLRGHTVDVVFAYYRMTDGGLFQVFVRVDSKQVRAKFGYPFLTEHALWPDDKNDQQTIEAIVSTGKLQVCFVAPGENGPCTGMFGIEGSLPPECVDSLKQEWHKLQEYHQSIRSRDFKACLDQYNLENPLEESPILMDSDDAEPTESSAENEGQATLGAVFKALGSADLEEGE